MATMEPEVSTANDTNLDPERPSSGDGAASARREAPPTAVLLRRALEQFATLFRQEVALATAEISGAIEAMKTGIGSIATGGAIMFAGFLALLSAATLALALVLPAWLAALIVGIVVLLIGYATLRAGQRRVDPARLKPVRTAATLRRSKEMLQNRRLS